MTFTLYDIEDVQAALSIGVAAFATAYLTDGLAIGILAGFIFFLVSLACFEAVRSGTVERPSPPSVWRPMSA